jgi:hypothetical protein
VLGHCEFRLEHRSNPPSRFGVTVKVARPFDLDAISAQQHSQNAKKPRSKSLKVVAEEVMTRCESEA